MLYTSNILRQRITVKKTRLAGVCLFREDYFKSSQRCLVLNLLQKFAERNVLEVLLRPLVQFHASLPAVVLANDDRANPMLDTVRHDELANMVEVVLQSEIPFLAGVLGIAEPVEMLVNALANATVDQYGSRLIGSYRSKIIQANINTSNTFCRGFVRDVLLILHIHDEAKSFGRDDHLLVVSDALDAEAIIARCDGCEFLILLGLSSFDGFVVEDNLSQFVFIVRRHRHFDELAWVFLVGVECFLEVRPVGQALTDRLFSGLGVMQLFETVLAFDGSDERVDVGQYLTTEPCFSHEERAFVVQFLAQAAESDNFRCSVYLVTLNE